MDAEESDLLASYEADEWQPISNLAEQMQNYSEYARATFKKDKRVNSRISSKDLETIQTRALEEGLPSEIGLNRQMRCRFVDPVATHIGNKAPGIKSTKRL